MIRFITLFSLLFAASAASATSTRKRVELENEIRQRVVNIVDRVDPLAIVQVTVNLKTVSTSLPGVGFTADVTPVEYDGDLGASSIQNINVRLVTQIDKVPDWIRKEIEKATKIEGVKISIAYEKAGGVIADKTAEVPKLGRLTVDAAIEGFKQLQQSLWGLVGAIFVALVLVAVAVFSMSGRLEKSLSRVIEDKVVPALAQSRPSAAAGPGESQESGPMTVSLEGGGGGGTGQKELADFPAEALLTLMADCYWTENDGYAHYLWTQITQAQREAILSNRTIDKSYFWHIVQTEPEKLDYHSDARYLILGAEFRTINQGDLLQWVKQNSKLSNRVTPMRWDHLELTLAERLEFNAAQNANKATLESAIKLDVTSSKRDLPVPLHIKTMRLEDEEFVWQNPDKVPVANRRAFKSLVWLALADEAFRRTTLESVDARELAEAWVGPEPVLNKLKEVLAPKKIETLEHFLNSVTPDRDNATFKFLCDSGLNAPITTSAGATADRSAA